MYKIALPAWSILPPHLPSKPSFDVSTKSQFGSSIHAARKPVPEQCSHLRLPCIAHATASPCMPLQSLNSSQGCSCFLLDSDAWHGREDVLKMWGSVHRIRLQYRVILRALRGKSVLHHVVSKGAPCSCRQGTACILLGCRKLYRLTSMLQCLLTFPIVSQGHVAGQICHHRARKEVLGREGWIETNKLQSKLYSSFSGLSTSDSRNTWWRRPVTPVLLNHFFVRSPGDHTSAK